jgi:hypothetical protein
MDRDVLFAVIVAVFGTALVGSFYFGGSSTPDTLSTAGNPVTAEERVYAPDDIRYALQQQELKERERSRKRKIVQATSPIPTPDDDGSGAAGVTDHPSVTDHAPVGEPDIE